MTEFVKKFNDYTKQEELHFTATLVSVAEAAQSNSNGTNFYPATVRYTNAQNEVVNRSCMIYENNLNKGMEAGQKYNTIATQGADGKVYLRMTHLQTTSPATADDFGDAFGTSEVEVAQPREKAVTEFN